MKILDKEYLKVSVVITTYKRSTEVLKRAIDSVLCQTYKNIELIVVDDNVNSELLDSNASCVKKYKDHDVAYVINEKVHGACAARNLGASYANGDVLAFLDDDDAWIENKLELMVPEITAEIGIVYCNSNYLRNDKVVRENVVIPKKADNNLEALLLTNYIGGCSMPIIRKDVFDAAGMFDESFPASQDLDLWIRIVQITNIKHVDKALVNYYLSDGSITRNLERQNQGRTMILNKYANIFEMYPSAKENRIFTIALTDILQGDYTKGLQFYKENSNLSGLEKMVTILKLLGKGSAKRIVNRVKGYN